MREVDVAVIGGGLVGISVAYGLLGYGVRTMVLDGSDDAVRASRGNFGLVWVQGKGLSLPPYSAWAMKAAACWGEFSARLSVATGIDAELEQKGGSFFALRERISSGARRNSPQ
jgi:glycine/D-amino acid oxidase-like deaminating enzyme